MIEKEELKFWTPISKDKSFPFFLNGLVKDDVKEIAQNLAISGISKLNKKQLIDKIVTEFPIGLNKIIRLFDEERLKYIKQLCFEGFIPGNKLCSYQQTYFSYLGLAYRAIEKGEKVLVMPNEVRDEIKKFPLESMQDMSKRNTEVIMLTLGMLEFYGVLDTKTLKRLLQRYIALDIETHDFFEIVYYSLGYYDKLDFQDGLFTDTGVMDALNIWKEHQRRPNVDYYHFTYEKLMEASKLHYEEITPKSEIFMEYIMVNFDLGIEDAKEIYFDVRFDTLNDVRALDTVQKVFDKLRCKGLNDAQRLMEVMVDLTNNMRKWVLKGNTSNELRGEETISNVIQMPLNQSLRIGRNDPCPCGSGKKYKKCCLN